MTITEENDKAAIVANLWDGERCFITGCSLCAVPDMKDPIFLIKALETVKFNIIWSRMDDWIVKEAFDGKILASGSDFKETLFNALVTKYDIDHSNV